MFCIIILWDKKGGAYSVSKKQKEILEIIKTFIKENGYSPTIREICRIANIKSTASVHAHIKKLKAEGHITSGVDMPRSIALTKREKNVKVVVNAIALMCTEDKEYILLQENKNKHTNESIFELPGGVIKESENVSMLNAIAILKIFKNSFIVSPPNFYERIYNFMKNIYLILLEHKIYILLVPYLDLFYQVNIKEETLHTTSFHPPHGQE